MNLPIPRFFLNRTTRSGEAGSIAINQVWLESLVVDAPDDSRGLVMFSSRRAAQAYIDHGNLPTEWLVTFFGYTELAGLLRACQAFGVSGVLVDPHESRFYAATIASILAVLDTQLDDGDERRASFEQLSALRPSARPRVK